MFFAGSSVSNDFSAHNAARMAQIRFVEGGGRRSNLKVVNKNTLSHAISAPVECCPLFVFLEAL